jgi:AcrR family transcriptional regulator
VDSADEPTGRRGGHEVRSRARRAKRLLGRQEIADTALAVLDREGIEAVTMRGVASLLETGPASLYVYFGSRDELLQAVLDTALAEVELTATADGDWRVRLEALIRSHYDILARHEGLAFVAMATIPTLPNALAIIEAMIELLVEGGVDDATVAWAVDIIGAYVTAAAAEQTMYERRQRTGQTESAYLADVAAAFDALPADRVPQTRRLREQLLAGSGDDRLTWGLRVLINGVVATPRTSTTE